MNNIAPKKLVDMLRLSDFVVKIASWENVNPKARKLWMPWDDPFMLICSYEDAMQRGKIYKVALEFGNDSPEYRDFIERLTTANLRERVRLLELLDQFYAHRFPKQYNRLIVQDNVGSSILLAQGSYVMRLPENADKREQWLEDVQKEMLAFADFLEQKREDKQAETQANLKVEQ